VKRTGDIQAFRTAGKDSRSVSALALLPWLLAAAPAWAEAGAASELGPAPEPSVESLREQIRQAEAQQAAEVQALKDQIAVHEVEAAVAHEREAAERERLLRLYGFADFGVMRTIAPDEARMASQFTVPLTFYLGRLNLYYDSHPSQHFRFLAETRLSLYPNGTQAGVYTSTGIVQRTSTARPSTSPAIRSCRCGRGSSSRRSASTTWTTARRRSSA
jgi:hypothetical protein